MSDAEFLSLFENAAISREAWTHRAHVKMAYLYLCRYPFSEALERVRMGIQRLNAANKVPEGPTTGYNETTTQAFFQLVAATREAYDGTLPTPDGESFCDAHPQLLTKHILRLYYSPERRGDPRAKTEFVEPDLAPLPKVSGLRS